MTAFCIDRRGDKAALVIRVFIICCVSVMFSSVTGWASHDRPVFIVDVNNNPDDDFDGDYHFHSLTAALTQFPNPGEDETIKLAPGMYNESIILNVEGLTLEATGELDQTAIQGQVTLAAKRVHIEGITIDATGLPFGISVTEDKAMVTGMNVFGAETGILLITGMPIKDMLLTGNHIYQNTIGIDAQDVRYATIHSNVVEDNSQVGGRFEAIYQVNFSSNTWRSNERGLILRDSRELELLHEGFYSNRYFGARLNAVDTVLINHAVVESNRAVGLRLDDVKDNQILNSRFRYNHQAGLRLENHSQKNVLQNNHFEAHTESDTAGLWVQGPVYDNVILENEFVDNWMGIKLTKDDGAPASNRFQNNIIINSITDGLYIEASEGDNIFRANILERNNRHGIYLAGGNDQLIDNQIEYSGAEGIWVDGAISPILQSNTSMFNQSNGLRVSGDGINHLINENILSQNFQHGLMIEAGFDLRIERNEMNQNHRHGAIIGAVNNLEFNHNQLQTNGELGVFIDLAEKLDAKGNKITGNQAGGVLIKSGLDLDLEGNAIVDNLHMGLRLEEGELIVKRNWWGDVLGPAGVFEGRGNAVIGIHLEQVVPWLPDEPQHIDLVSSDAEILDAVGREETIEIDLLDRAGVRLELSELGVDEDGKRVPISLGAILLSKYQQVKLENIPTLPDTLALYNVQLSGLKNGVANMLVDISEYANVNLNQLALWYWNGEQWLGLPGHLREAAQQISGEIHAHFLKPGLIALAPRSSEAREFMPSVSSANSNSVSGSDRNTIIARSSQTAFRPEDFSLVFLGMIALGIRRLMQKYPNLHIKLLDLIQFRNS